MSVPDFPHLLGGQALRVNRVPMVHEPVAAGQAVDETTSTAAVELGTLAGAEFGIREMSAGTLYGVEAEEIFIVTAGHGAVVIGPFEGHPARTADLVPGTVMRLSAGMQTTWTVTEPLRKVYFTPAHPTGSTS